MLLNTAAFILVLAATPAAWAATTPAVPVRAHLYIGTENNVVRRCAYYTNGTLVYKGGAANEGYYPTTLAMGPARDGSGATIVYVGDGDGWSPSYPPKYGYEGQSRLFAYTLIPTTGSLVPINNTYFPGIIPSAMRVVGDGKALLVSSRAGESLTTIALQPAGGLGDLVSKVRLGPVEGEDVSALLPSTTDILVRGDSVYAVEGSLRYMAPRALDAATGVLGPHPSKQDHLKLETGVWMVLSHPSLPYMYGLGKKPMNVKTPLQLVTMRLDASGQVGVSAPSTPVTLAPEWLGGGGFGGGAFHPNARWIYTSSSSLVEGKSVNALIQWELDAKTGVPTLSSWIPLPWQPGRVAINAAGTQLFCLTTKYSWSKSKVGNTLRHYDIDRTTGKLTKAGAVDLPELPHDLMLVELTDDGKVMMANATANAGTPGTGTGTEAKQSSGAERAYSVLLTWFMVVGACSMFWA
jgi:hypothetical protein